MRSDIRNRLILSLQINKGAYIIFRIVTYIGEFLSFAFEPFSKTFVISF